MARFQRIYSGFKDRGLRMKRTDFPTVALLSFLEQPSEDVVARVLRDREQLYRMPKSPTRQHGFNLACNTTFLSMATEECPRNKVLDTQRMEMVLDLVQSEEAARLATLAAATAASS